MKRHVVAAGDCIASIADANGHFWETVWNDDANAPLRARRDDPFILQPGDVVAVPDLRVVEVERATGQRHRFRRKGVPEKLRLQLLDAGGRPRAGLEYRVEVDGRARTGRTDGDGRLEQWIAPGAAAGVLTIPSTGEAWTLALGHLDPVGTLSGVQARLANLGYLAGPLTDALDDATLDALARFQSDAGLEPTGEPDDDTRAALKRAWGG